MVFDLGIWVYVTEEETRKEKKRSEKSNGEASSSRHKLVMRKHTVQQRKIMG